MRICLLLFTILSVPAVSQTLRGTVAKIDKDQLEVKGPDGVVSFTVDEKTTIAKLKKCNQLSTLAVGDEVRVNYYGEGAFTAVNISAKVAISGTVTEAGPNHLKVLPDAPGDQKTTVFIFLDVSGKLGPNRGQLVAGSRIQVVGWDTGEGIIEAEKITAPDSGRPSRTVPQRPRQ